MTIGGVQSNHTRQVAAVAAKIGMKCRLVQESWVPFQDAVYDRVGNILMSRVMGAEIELVDEGFDIGIRESWERALRDVKDKGGTPYPIPAGASVHKYGGLGFVGFGPGTVIWYAVFVAITLIFTIGCGLLGDEGEAWWGKDPSNVVADEVAGMALVLALFPPTIEASSGWFYAWLLGAFLIFRVADIVKPWPARQWQRIPGGWGIVLDDLAAAVHAAVPIIVLALLLPPH